MIKVIFYLSARSIFSTPSYPEKVGSPCVLKPITILANLGTGLHLKLKANISNQPSPYKQFIRNLPFTYKHESTIYSYLLGWDCGKGQRPVLDGRRAEVVPVLEDNNGYTASLHHIAGQTAASSIFNPKKMLDRYHKQSHLEWSAFAVLLTLCELRSLGKVTIAVQRISFMFFSVTPSVLQINVISRLIARIVFFLERREYVPKE